MSLEKSNNYLKFKGSIILEYLRLQKKYSDEYGEKTIVLMQIGGFHECYCTKDEGYDLHKLSHLLNIIVSKKNKKKKEVSVKCPYMLGFPIVATPKYIKLLINNGYHVIVIDQVTNPPNPKRKITGIYSPGTFVDNNEITTSKTNYIVSIYIEEIKQLNGNYMLYIGLTAMELSIGKIIIHEIYSKKNDENYSLDNCIKFILNYDPKEIIIRTFKLKSITIENLLKYLELNSEICLINKDKVNEYQKINYQNEILKEIYNSESYLNPIEDLNLEKLNNGRISFIILLNYCYKNNLKILRNLNEPEFYQDDEYLHLGNNAVKQLNLISSDNKAKYNSLFDIINFTETNMGKRLLIYNLKNPLCNIDHINKRYELIDDIKENKNFDKIKEILKNIYDIDRITRKIGLATINPINFINFHDSLLQIQELYKLIKKTKLIKIFTKEIYTNIRKFIKFYKSRFDLDKMSKYIITDITESIYHIGIYPEIDKLQNEINLSKNKIDEIRLELNNLIEEKRKKKTHFDDNTNKDNNMVSLNYNDRDKYYFLTTKRRAIMIKKNIKKLKYDVKFKDQKSNTKITIELLDDLSNNIILKTELLKGKIIDIYKSDLNDIYNKYNDLFILISNMVGLIDFLNSGCLCSINNRFHKPQIKKNKKSFIKCSKLRHPIIEKLIDVPYITHDINFNDKITGILLFGLNSAGKSSLMKAIGVNIILAQIGYYVAASSFIYYPYKSLFTRISGTDNIFKGLSSFAYELSELKAILKRSGSNTLVLADEVCKGTETKSAIVIVSSMINILLDRKTTFISATHLHELTKLDNIKKLKKLRICHLSITYKDDNIIFDRLLKEGNGTEEYGLDFAKFIINDKDFINLSNDIKNKIDKKNLIISNKKSRYNSKIYMDKCMICNQKKKLETHHIEFQKNCDINGFINNPKLNHIHKNHESNLIVLCSKCHDNIHNNSLIIHGYNESIKGKILDIKKN